MENEKRLPVAALLIGISYFVWPFLLIGGLAVVYGFRLDQGDPSIFDKATALFGIGILLSLFTWRFVYAGRENDPTLTSCYYTPRWLFWYRVRVVISLAFMVLMNGREFFCHTAWYQSLDQSRFFLWANLLVLMEMGEFGVRLIRQWADAIPKPNIKSP